jgi:ferritin-like metal-binding protein YciE
MSDSTVSGQVRAYLSDAHSIEEQALAQLRSAPDHAGDESLAQALRAHLAETEGHERLVRERLDQLGDTPSRIKDLLMAAGGKGFVLFARSQPDTPGKLAAHAYSYEHLELASYELLRRVADMAGDDVTVVLAARIAGEERAMGERLAVLFDQTTEASLAMIANPPAEALKSYLSDAHAIEEQSIGLLERAAELAGDPGLASAYEQHLKESRRHQARVEARLGAVGGSSSHVKDIAMHAGAINWATFFQAQPDTPGKVAAFAYAFEHLEIGGYEQLMRVASAAEDEETATMAQEILAEERSAGATIASHWDAAAAASLEAVGAR